MKVIIQYDEEENGKAMNALNLSDTMADINTVRSKIDNYFKDGYDRDTAECFLEEIYREICEIQDFEL